MSTTILNACTKEVLKLIDGPTYVFEWQMLRRLTIKVTILFRLLACESKAELFVKLLWHKKSGASKKSALAVFSREILGGSSFPVFIHFFLLSIFTLLSVKPFRVLRGTCSLECAWHAFRQSRINFACDCQSIVMKKDFFSFFCFV